MGLRRGEERRREASALHPKVLCELLHLQQVFGVDCGTGGGQRAQHVRLREGAEVYTSVTDVFKEDSPGSPAVSI